jgi:hypothetical protein
MTDETLHNLNNILNYLKNQHAKNINDWLPEILTLQDVIKEKSKSKGK